MVFCELPRIFDKPPIVRICNLAQVQQKIYAVIVVYCDYGMYLTNVPEEMVILENAGPVRTFVELCTGPVIFPSVKLEIPQNDIWTTTELVKPTRCSHH